MKIIRMRNADGTQYLTGDDCWADDISHAKRFFDESAEEELGRIQTASGYGIGEYGVHNARMIDAPVLNVITQSTVEDFDGADVWIVARVNRDETDAEIATAVKDAYPVEHCQHEHDCCGRMYSQGATWVRAHEDHILIRQSYIRNV